MDDKTITVAGTPVALEVPTPAPIDVTIAEIDARVTKFKHLMQEMEILRRNAAALTFPNDWVSMGEQVFLEGDGALRMASAIGFGMTNLRKDEETIENGVVRVTYTADASSALFGTFFPGVSKSRRTDDQFLRGKGERADIEDVRQAVYKGLVGKCVQICAAMTGLTAEVLKAHYGIDVKAKVEYRTGASDAKKADQAAVAATGGVAEIHRILRKISGGEPDLAKQILVDLTVNKEKGWAGKTDPEQLTEKGVAFVLKKLREREADYDHAIEATEGGRD